MTADGRETASGPRLTPPRMRSWRGSPARGRSADLDALVALADRATCSCPCRRCRWNTRAGDVVARFCALLFGAGRRFDLVPARANGQPAFGAYLRPPVGIRHGTGLYVLTLAGDPDLRP